MATVRTANAAQSRINMVLYGGHGAGKSTYALGAAYLKREDGKPFRILYIDNEMGSVDDYVSDLEENGIDTRNILIVYTTSLVETKEFITQATAKEPFLDEDGNPFLDADGEPFVADMIVIDGSSVLHKSALQARREFSKKRATVRVNKKENANAAERFVAIEGADIELKDYNVLNFEGQSLVLDLTGCGLHYIITAREKEIITRRIIKDSNGNEKEVTENTGEYEPEGFKGLEYNAKTVARIWRDEDGIVKMKCSKDRTHTYKEGVEYEDPTILEFQKTIEKNKGKSKFAPSNTMNADIKREMEKVEREVLGTTIEEAGCAPNINVALVSSTATEDTAELDTLKAEYKAMYDSLNIVQKDALKTSLKEHGFKGVGHSGVTSLAEMNTRIELIKAAKNS